MGLISVVSTAAFARQIRVFKIPARHFAREGSDPPVNCWRAKLDLQLIEIHVLATKTLGFVWGPSCLPQSLRAIFHGVASSCFMYASCNSVSSSSKYPFRHLRCSFLILLSSLWARAVRCHCWNNDLRPRAKMAEVHVQMMAMARRKSFSDKLIMFFLTSARSVLIRLT